jgi:butyryl-CoA dehydrogenase
VDLELSDEQQRVREKVQHFVQTELLPVAKQIDRERRIPRAVIASMATQGVWGLPIPCLFGGLGMGSLDSAEVIKTLALACASTAAMVSLQHNFISAPIARFGSELQRHTYLPALAKGQQLGCWALAEETAGEELTMLETSATSEGEEVILRGTKTFVTCGAEADLAIVFARLVGSADPSVFLVPIQSSGISISPAYDTLGLRGLRVVTLTLDGVRIPKTNLLGGLGRGPEIARYVFEGARIGVAALCTGIHTGVLNFIATHALTTSIHGDRLSDRQDVQFRLAEMSMECDAGRMLFEKAAVMRDKGLSTLAESAMAKMIASESASRAAAAAINIAGGRGILAELPLERFLRDAKNTEVCLGTGEVLRLTIASTLLKE